MIRTSPPIIRSTLTDTLVQGILTFMRDENLQTGDRLPSVRELAETFQVAVPTIREAIRRLEVFGVIKVRHGAGIFVRTAHPPLMLANPTVRRISTQVILDLVDTRILFEPYCAECAARKPDSPEVAELAAVLDRAKAFLDTDDARLQEANMSFHIGIAICAGNSVLAQVMTLLAEIYSSEQSAMLVVSNQRIRDYKQHRDVFKAIRAGLPDRARDLMYQHLMDVRRTVEERFSVEAIEIGVADADSFALASTKREGKAESDEEVALSKR